MYEFIEGKLVEKSPVLAVIDVNGTGYLLNISLNTFSKLGDGGQCKLYTHLVIREDAQQLFGFADKEERDLFRLLISVSGIGPNTGRLLLSSLTVNELKSAIAGGQVATLKGVKGIGEKSAQRIIVDLKDKLDRADISFEKIDDTHNTLRQEALSGLVVLGFQKKAAEKALEKVIKEFSQGAGEKGSGVTVEFLIKESLKNL